MISLTLRPFCRRYRLGGGLLVLRDGKERRWIEKSWPQSKNQIPFGQPRQSHYYWNVPSHRRQYLNVKTTCCIQSVCIFVLCSFYNDNQRIFGLTLRKTKSSLRVIYNQYSLHRKHARPRVCSQRDIPFRVPIQLRFHWSLYVLLFPSHRVFVLISMPIEILLLFRNSAYFLHSCNTRWQKQSKS
jgi:hypothetical protein